MNRILNAIAICDTYMAARLPSVSAWKTRGCQGMESKTCSRYGISQVRYIESTPAQMSMCSDDVSHYSRSSFISLNETFTVGVTRPTRKPCWWKKSKKYPAHCNVIHQQATTLLVHTYWYDTTIRNPLKKNKKKERAIALRVNPATKKKQEAHEEKQGGAKQKQAKPNSLTKHKKTREIWRYNWRQPRENIGYANTSKSGAHSIHSVELHFCS